MPQKRFYSLIVLFTIFALAFSACAPAAPTATQAPVATQATEAPAATEPRQLLPNLQFLARARLLPWQTCRVLRLVRGRNSMKLQSLKPPPTAP